MNRVDFGEGDWNCLDTDARCQISTRGRTTATMLLNRRAQDAAIGAEHAAVPRLRAQQFAATLAFVEILAGIGRHGFQPFTTAGRTGDFRDEDHASYMSIRIQG